MHALTIFDTSGFQGLMDTLSTLLPVGPSELIRAYNGAICCILLNFLPKLAALYLTPSNVDSVVPTEFNVRSLYAAHLI